MAEALWLRKLAVLFTGYCSALVDALGGRLYEVQTDVHCMTLYQTGQ